jgi:hypothetical protein
VTDKVQSFGATVDYAFDWSAWLAAGDTITAHQWTIDPDASPSMLTNASAPTVLVTLPSRASLAAGSPKRRKFRWRVACQITTDTGKTPRREFFLQAPN